MEVGYALTRLRDLALVGLLLEKGPSERVVYRIEGWGKRPE